MTDLIEQKIKSYRPNKTVPPINDFTLASVLIILTEHNNELSLVLTKRTAHLPTHKGQVAFPGGAMDESDADLTETALREAFEEIGTEPHSITVFGSLDEFFTISDYLVTPVVSVLKSPVRFQANPDEIDRIFYVPLSHFLNKKNLRIEEWERKGVKRNVNFWEYDSEIIWGLTAEIIRHFISVCFGNNYFDDVMVSESRQQEMYRKLSAD